MKVRSITVAGVALLTLGVAPRTADAWGNEGHRIICQIALERLTPAGQALVAAIGADLGEVRDPFDNCPACNNNEDDGRFMTFRPVVFGLTSRAPIPSKALTSTTSSTSRKVRPASTLSGTARRSTASR